MRTLPTSFKQVSDLNEIVFADRNKSYGAYELRKHYNERLLKAFLITAFFSLVLMLFISFAMHHNPKVFVDVFPADSDSVKTFNFEEKKIPKKPSSQKYTTTDQPPTLIVNDTASERKEKHDSLNVETVSSNSTISGDSGIVSGISGNHGIAYDSISSGKNSEQTDIVISEVMPSFPGGDRALARYIQKHFDCGGENISGEGKIVLRFVVMKDGSIARVEVLRDNVGIDCVNEARNLLLNSPRWNPGLQNNQPVNVMLVLPISIQRGY